MRLNFCVACGDGGNLHFHHLVPRSIGGHDGDDNIVTFCGLCHGKIHGVGDVWSCHRELTRQALQHMKAQGRVVGSIPHGYIREGDSVVPHDAERRVVALARDLRDRGLTLRAIGGELAARGALNRAGRPYQPESVRALLRAAG